VDAEDDLIIVIYML